MELSKAGSRTSIPTTEQRILQIRSGNRCAFPGCGALLLKPGPFGTRPIVIGEMAHIVSETPDGPRGRHALPAGDHNKYANLIFLCSIHHTEIDAKPEVYTVEHLRQMKQDHEKSIETAVTQAKQKENLQIVDLPLINEVLYSTLLPVTRMPKFIFSAPCKYGDAQQKEAGKQVHVAETQYLCPFIIRGGGILFTFHDLRNPDGPFRDIVVEHGKVRMIEHKFQLLDRKDFKPDYVVVSLPENLAEKIFSINYEEPDLGMVHRDFRRAIKARVMKYKFPTQLMDQKTIEFRDADHPAKIAWNFFTGLYFKAGGSPWGPTGLTPGTCYMGVRFYRGIGSANPAMFTSLVQAFDEHGEGLVFRGPDFEWNPLAHEHKTPHMKMEDALRLVDFALSKYSSEMHQLPSRVVIHKSSRWTDEERTGVREGLRGKVSRHDLVALQKQDAVRLITVNKYPPLRGTRFSVGDLDFLYTTGFVAELGQFHRAACQAPFVHRGEGMAINKGSRTRR